MFLPSCRVLPSSLTGEVLTDISASSDSVEASGDVSRVIVVESVADLARAARGFSGVRVVSRPRYGYDPEARIVHLMYIS